MLDNAGNAETVSETKTSGYAADNVDVMTKSLDGKNTFHGTGLIFAHISSGSFTDKVIPRNKVTEEQLQTHEIMIKSYPRSKEMQTLDSIQLRELTLNRTLLNPAPLMTVEYLRAAAALKYCSVPQLSGAMRVMTKHDEVTGKHKIEFLGIIDLPSTDMSCVYTTLLFVEAQHKKMKLPGHGVCTFDQPLWQKAMIVKAHMNIHMVIMLGNFHVQMSFLGCIGYVMTNSGLEKAHISIYGDKYVKKIINGKDNDWPMRANSLRKLLLQQIPEEKQYAVEAAQLYFKLLMENDKSIFRILEGNPVVDNLMEIINESRELSPPNKLFFTYI